MIKFFKRGIKKIKAYDRIAGIGEIARRYFAINSFDGVLTILGLLVGSYVGGIRDPKVVIFAGLGISIAMMVSGMWGAYITEHAERRKSLRELEQSTLIKLHHTDIGKASRFATRVVALINGLSPFITALIVLTPFFFSKFFNNIENVYYASGCIAFTILFLVGTFLGKISKENLIKTGLKMVLAGIVCALLGWLVIR